jgi:hypothetical protein
MGSKAVQTQILDADADVVEYDPISFPWLGLAEALFVSLSWTEYESALLLLSRFVAVPNLISF